MRIQRSLAREGQQDRPCVAEVCRRVLADEEDFSREKLKRAGVAEHIVNEDMDVAMAQIDELFVKFNGDGACGRRS